MKGGYPVRRNRYLSVALSLMCLGIMVLRSADVDADGVVQVSDAWVRETVPGQSVGAAYMQIRSTERVDLVEAETKVSKSAEIHHMSMKDGLMKMRELNAVSVTPNEEVNLAPGGTHVMLVDLKHPLKVGEKVALRLTFRRENGTTFKVAVPAVVKPMIAGATHEH